MSDQAEVKETIHDWLTRISQTITSVPDDSATMQIVLRKIGFPKAVCTGGIVYIEGKGESDSLHVWAGAILEAQQRGDAKDET